MYIIAAAGTGIAGAVIYLNLLRVQPEAGFSLQWSALMIFSVVIGGLGTIEGPIIGAVIFFVLQQLLADYGTWYLVLIGALAAGVVVFAQRGLWGTHRPQEGSGPVPRPAPPLPGDGVLHRGEPPAERGGARQRSRPPRTRRRHRGLRAAAAIV